MSFLTWMRQTLAALVAAPPSTTTVTDGKPDVVATVAAYLESKSMTIGPMLRTHGVVHKISVGTAEEDAEAIVAAAAKYNLKVSLLTSIVEQESLGDDLAVDPNAFLAKPGESAKAAFEHTDFGNVQLDGKTLEGLPELKGETIAQMEQKAETPAWAMDLLGKTLVANATHLKLVAENDPTVLRNVPNGDVRIPLANTWNAGLTGTIATLRSPALNLKYGEQVIARADALASTMDVASS